MKICYLLLRNSPFFSEVERKILWVWKFNKICNKFYSIRIPGRIKLFVPSAENPQENKFYLHILLKMMGSWTIFALYWKFEWGRVSISIRQGFLKVEGAILYWSFLLASKFSNRMSTFKSSLSILDRDNFCLEKSLKMCEKEVKNPQTSFYF